MPNRTLCSPQLSSDEFQGLLKAAEWCCMGLLKSKLTETCPWLLHSTICFQIMICNFVSVLRERLRNAALKGVRENVSSAFYPAIKILNGVTTGKQINA